MVLNGLSLHYRVFGKYNSDYNKLISNLSGSILKDYDILSKDTERFRKD
jgi:hypothetical protein